MIKIFFLNMCIYTRNSTFEENLRSAGCLEIPNLKAPCQLQVASKNHQLIIGILEHFTNDPCPTREETC